MLIAFIGSKASEGFWLPTPKPLVATVEAAFVSVETDEEAAEAAAPAAVSASASSRGANR